MEEEDKTLLRKQQYRAEARDTKGTTVYKLSSFFFGAGILAMFAAGTYPELAWLAFGLSAATFVVGWLIKN